ncbi:MAG: XdhC family protein [Planctomycetaceae bacterium]|nr:XdhC family protein [Planctomycetaceae bacterium]
MQSIWEEAVTILAAGESFVLAAIVNRQGSAPGVVGSIMLVKQDGSILGSVGGGAMEAKALETAQELFAASGGWRIVRVDLAGKDAAEAGMVCGGTAEIFLDLVTRDDLPAFEVARGCDLENGRGYLSYTLDGDSRSVTFLDDVDPDASGEKVIRIPMRGNGTLFIFGGGHVGLETARIADMVGFKTVVLDDREDFVNPSRFPDATPILLESFDDLPDLGIDDHCYIVIVTRGHLHDLTVLDYALRTNAAYIGMIGSRRKRDLVYERMHALGHDRDALDRVHSPIGLAIGSETPAEIAVSIVAELIRTRADATGRSTQ